MSRDVRSLKLQVIQPALNSLFTRRDLSDKGPRNVKGEAGAHL